MTDDFEKLDDAAERRDVDALRRLVAAGADINACDHNRETVFCAAVERSLHCDDGDRSDARFDVPALLLQLGADPNRLDIDGSPILLLAIYSVDPAMVRFLLRHGADPNHGCAEPWENIYEAADFDYQYEAWFQPQLPALKPDDRAIYDNDDTYLAFLEREAAAKGYLAPEIMRLLRDHGALSRREMALRLNGAVDDRIIWRDGRWQLDVPTASA